MEMGSGVPILFGDATNRSVLRQVRVEQARVLVIATSDPFGARRVVQLSREMNPSLHIIVRTRYLKELEELQQLGANEVIPEEFETSIEMSALVLQTFKLPKATILDKADQIRREGYALLRRGDMPEMVHHLRAGTLVEVEVETCRIDEESPALGKSLEELSIRPKTGASVIALMRAGVTQSNPSPKTILEPSDILALLGHRDAIRRAMSYLVDSKSE